MRKIVNILEYALMYTCFAVAVAYSSYTLYMIYNLLTG